MAVISPFDQGQNLVAVGNGIDDDKADGKDQHLKGHDLLRQNKVTVQNYPGITDGYMGQLPGCFHRKANISNIRILMNLLDFSA